MSAQSQNPQNRSWRWILPAAALTAILAVAFVAVSSNGGDADPVEAAAPAFETVEANQQDLVEYTNLDGTMQYANVVSVVSGMPGTVTTIVDTGAEVARGDTVYALDANPVVLFYGDVPLYRTMSEGDEGQDVRLIEENLASLGFHTYQDDDGQDVNTGFVVDGLFDGATEDAVERFQEHYGLDETGSLDPATLVIVSGPAKVINAAAELGTVTQAGTPIVDLSVSSTVDAFYAAHSGDLDLEPTTGPIANGTVIYTVDDVPVSAVLVEAGTDLVLTRNLYYGVADGPDVAAVEQMLADLGYDADGELVVDDEFDAATTEAINDWEDDLDDKWPNVVDDGAVATSEIILVDPATDLATVSPQVSDVTASGSELATTSSPGPIRMVTTEVAVADQETMVEGQEVQIEFPDGAVVSGTVSSVATSSTVTAGDPEAEPTLAVEIALTEVPEAATELTELDVSVLLVDRIASGATVVPASALVATADGGFAVEVDTGGGTTQFVAVDPGQFTDGLVEVEGIDPGTAVVVPR